jgi:plastocyanin
MSAQMRVEEKTTTNFGVADWLACRGVGLSSLAASVVGLALCLLQPLLVSGQDQQVQVIELKAKKYEFFPSPIHVKAGTKVELKITAVDHDHGFRIAVDSDGAKLSDKPGLALISPQDCVQLKKGETTTIEFLAQTPGTYLFWCCHTCGLGHKGMKGELVVD